MAQLKLLDERRVMLSGLRDALVSRQIDLSQAGPDGTDLARGFTAAGGAGFELVKELLEMGILTLNSDHPRLDGVEPSPELFRVVGNEIGEMAEAVVDHMARSEFAVEFVFYDEEECEAVEDVLGEMGYVCDLPNEPSERWFRSLVVEPKVE